MTDDSTIELQLLRWNEGPAGRTVTFLIRDETPSHPFKNLRVGPANGQRLGAAFVLIADDESTVPLEQAVVRSTRTTEQPAQAPDKPVDGPSGNGAGKPKGGRLAREAGRACRDARFRKFLEGRYPLGLASCDNDVAVFVRVFCRVTSSRAELDTNPDAADRWNALYAEYLVDTA